MQTETHKLKIFNTDWLGQSDWVNVVSKDIDQPIASIIPGKTEFVDAIATHVCTGCIYHCGVRPSQFNYGPSVISFDRRNSVNPSDDILFEYFPRECPMLQPGAQLKTEISMGEDKAKTITSIRVVDASDNPIPVPTELPKQ